jgi:hypothetical protein
METIAIIKTRWLFSTLKNKFIKIVEIKNPFNIILQIMNYNNLRVTVLQFTKLQFYSTTEQMPALVSTKTCTKGTVQCYDFEVRLTELKGMYLEYQIVDDIKWQP